MPADDGACEDCGPSNTPTYPAGAGTLASYTLTGSITGPGQTSGVRPTTSTTTTTTSTPTWGVVAYGVLDEIPGGFFPAIENYWAERDYIVGSTDKYPCDIIRSNTLTMPDNAKLKDLPSSWVFSKPLHGYTSCTCINTAAPKAAVGTLTCPDITTKVACPQSSGTFSCVGSGNDLIL